MPLWPPTRQEKCTIAFRVNCARDLAALDLFPGMHYQRLAHGIPVLTGIAFAMLLTLAPTHRCREAKHGRNLRLRRAAGA